MKRAEVAAEKVSMPALCLGPRVFMVANGASRVPSCVWNRRLGELLLLRSRHLAALSRFWLGLSQVFALRLDMGSLPSHLKYLRTCTSSVWLTQLVIHLS